MSTFYYIQLQRSTDTGSTYSNYMTFSMGTTAAYDTNISLNGTYYYRLFTTRSFTLPSASISSSFSNTASLYVDPLVAFEQWDEYTLAQSTSFDSGSGWTSPWTVVSLGNPVAIETWERFIIGQSTGFNNNNTIYGWGGEWSVTLAYKRTIASESFSNFDLGQTSSFTGSFGFENQWKVQTSGTL